MKSHTKIYMEALGYDLGDPTEFRPSEISGQTGIDIHHIVNREDRIENLILLTREEHVLFGEVKNKMVFLLKTHQQFLKDNGVIFSNEWFNKWISFYEN